MYKNKLVSNEVTFVLFHLSAIEEGKNENISSSQECRNTSYFKCLASNGTEYEQPEKLLSNFTAVKGC